MQTTGLSQNIRGKVTAGVMALAVTFGAVAATVPQTAHAQSLEQRQIALTADELPTTMTIQEVKEFSKQNADTYVLHVGSQIKDPTITPDLIIEEGHKAIAIAGGPKADKAFLLKAGKPLGAYNQEQLYTGDAVIKALQNAASPQALLQGPSGTGGS